jgi:hypothetical protein
MGPTLKFVNTGILRAGAIAAALSLAACGGGQHSASGPQGTADAATRAAYNDDFSGLTSRFDDALRPQVTRSQVGTLSDKMHKLGSYRGLTFVGNDPSKSEYTYRANFSGGSADVVVRMDPDGRFGAYRVFFEKDAAAP